MRVAVLAAEAVPYSKTGGLGDVAGALPKALRQIGADAFLITPLYRQTREKLIDHPAIGDLWIDWRGQNYKAQVYYSEANGSPTFLIHALEMFFRDSIYGYREDYERFAFFNHAAILLMRRLGRAPDIVHLNDWHCGFAAVEIAKLRRWDSFWQNTRTVFSVHNLAYQGAFGMDELWKLGFGDDFSRNAFAFNGAASALKAGLADADMLSTVSRRYGYEIQQPENGYGLDWLLRERSNKLQGIVNGVDYDVWNPEVDAELSAHFNAYNLSGKDENKRALLDKFFLPVDLEKPVFASVTRLTAQKGFELIQQTIGDILATGAYFVALGSGDKSYEDFLQKLRNVAPNQVGVYIGYNESLAHLIEAGADMFLMPSKFEPCGLNQMYSLKYGTVPIVHAVGGLDDTVHNFDAVQGTGNGFKFNEFRADKFLEKIYESLFCYYDKDAWRRLQWNGMNEDNSWQNAAKKYIQLYSMM
ncbi:MAG: glycogen synthase [Pyrinomonadaceae bacterium]